MMKKFMILMLSLAVLFSFAACDNSSTTPGGEEEEQPVVSVTDTEIESALEKVLSSGDLNGGIQASMEELLAVGDRAAEAEKITVTYGADYTTLTVEKSVSDASQEGTYPAQSVKVEVNAINVTPAGNDGSSTKPYEVEFDSFTYSFNTWTDGRNGNIVPVSGSIKGYFANSVKATIIEDEDGVDTYTIAYQGGADSDALVIVFGDKASDFTLSVNNAAATSSRVFDIAGTVLSTASFSAYESEMNKTFKTEVDKFVSALIGDGTTGAALFEKLETLTGASGLNVTYDKTANSNAGAITITFSKPTAATPLIGDGSTKLSLSLTKESPEFKIVIAGVEGSQATDNAMSAATATISGTLSAFDKPASSFDEIVIENLVVKIDSATAKVTVTNGDPALGSLKMVKTDMKGSASAEVPYGPSITLNADKESVSLSAKTYAREYTATNPLA